jgi:uncharacterized membrane protein
VRSLARTLVAPAPLGIASLGCLALLAIQERVPGTAYLDFLSWNLFLAWVPLVLAIAAGVLQRAGSTARVAAAACAAAWLAFFPNAPYIVTDVVHLEARGGALVVDAATIGAFALTGLLLAFASLQRMHGLVRTRLGSRAGWAMVAGVSLLTGFGVYLGRVLRWNSWEVVSEPGALAADVGARLADPLAHGWTLAVTFGFGAAFLAWYVSVWRLVEPAGTGARRSPTAGP